VTTLRNRFKNRTCARNRQLFKKPAFCFVAWFVAGLGFSSSFAYEVWMGTHLMESSVASNLNDWSLTASRLDGVNINRALDDSVPASNSDWRTVLGQLGNVSNTLVPLARPQISM
jgi:hypothetical protein